jgi:N-methylhydantoinase A
VLGRLDPERFAEGRIPLDIERAKQAVLEVVGVPLGLNAAEAAQGICEIVDENMANAARVHAAEQGADLGAYTLIAFGGSGPLHAARLARKLGMRRVIVPLNPSVGSAVGFLQARAAYELVRSHYLKLSEFHADVINTIFEELAAAGREVVAACALGAELHERRSALMRYLGQGHEIEVEVPAGKLSAASGEELRERYETRYRQAYGKPLGGMGVEVLTWSLVVSTPERAVAEASRSTAQRAAPVESQREVFDGRQKRALPVPVYLRPRLSPGMGFTGPALVVEAQTTTVVPDACRVSVDSERNLILEFKPKEQRS